MLWRSYRMPKDQDQGIYAKCTVSFTKASKLYIDCQHHEHVGDHLPPFAQGAIFGSKQGK